MREQIGSELSACRRVVLCVKSISLPDSNFEIERKAQVQLKIKAVKVVIWYLNVMINKWGTYGGGNDSSLERLYGFLPIVGKLCELTAQPFNMEVADRIVDSLNNVADSRYNHIAVEDQSLPAMLWILQYLLGVVMFLGVAFIISGSEALNIGMCLSVTGLIGLNALVLADLDMPYVGFIQVSPEPILV